MIAADDGRAVRVYPAENVQASPLRYEIDPREIHRVMEEIEGSGLDAGGDLPLPHPQRALSVPDRHRGRPGRRSRRAVVAGHDLRDRRRRRRRARGARLSTSGRGRRGRRGAGGRELMAAATEPLVCPSCAETYPLDDRFCARCKMPLVYAGAQGIEAPVTPTHERARKIKRQYAEGDLVRVAGGRNQAEAEFIQGLLLEEGVPSMLRRSAGFDVPDYLAAGPRDVLVPASGARDGAGRPPPGRPARAPARRACPAPPPRCWPRSSARSLSWRSSSGSGPAGSPRIPPGGPDGRARFRPCA